MTPDTLTSGDLVRNRLKKILLGLLFIKVQTSCMSETTLVSCVELRRKYRVFVGVCYMDLFTRTDVKSF